MSGGDLNSQAQSNDDEAGPDAGYIGEFQTEYINQEVYTMFERDDMVSREDLYRCAKAMGGWSQQDGKFYKALIPFFYFQSSV